ncbi:MAG TPA: LytR C-terminal domain-containing protein, partial [Gaiellaceae bacterium]
TSVTVLNGSGLAGAAAAQASRVRARGYLVGEVGNAPRSGYGRSVVMYRAGRRPEAMRLARDLHIRLVSPLDGLHPRDLLGAQLAVVVGG